MSPWFEAAMAKYGWIWIGLTVGFAAKYALLIKRGVPIRGALVLADILLLPIVALISYELATRAGAVAEPAALMTAIATVCADRLVKLYTERFMGQVEGEVRQVAQRVKGELAQEVQVEMSAKAVIDDHLTGKAPPEYVALRPKRTP